MPYNVGGYGGVSFWAQGNTSIRVMLPTTQITPAAEGGSCATNCSDAHGKVLALTGTWTQYTIPFAQLAQEGWGAMAAFDTSSVLSIQFQVTANAVFDYWIDDIAFF
jgi:hypothetical protein